MLYIDLPLHIFYYYEVFYRYSSNFLRKIQNLLLDLIYAELNDDFSITRPHRNSNLVSD